MEFEKLKIVEVAKLKKGADILLPFGGAGFSFVDGKIVSYQIEKTKVQNKDNIPEDLRSILKKREDSRLEAEEEFREKFQIRPGKFFYEDENGMIAMPEVSEKFFETKTSTYVKGLFENFFNKSELVAEKFKRYKRAYLLYSDPGMGKSALLRNFCNYAATSPGTAIVQTHGDINFGKITNIFLKPYHSDVKRIVLIIEDFGKRDYISNTNVLNPTCLNFLDGFVGLFRVPTLILCTTNFIRQLGPQLTNRPGRFNKLIKVLPPSEDEIFELIRLLSGTEVPEEKRIAFRGLPLSPDHVIEALLRQELEGISIEKAAYDVIKEREGLTSWENL